MLRRLLDSARSLSALSGFLLSLAITQFTASAQAQVAQGDSVSIRLVDADLRATAQLLGRYLDRPVIVGAVTNNARVTVETPRPIPRAEVLPLLRGVLATHNIELVVDSSAGIYQLRMKDQRPQALPPQSGGGMIGGPGLQLFVIRLRHARAVDVAAAVNALYGRGGMIGKSVSDRARSRGSFSSIRSLRK